MTDFRSSSSRTGHSCNSIRRRPRFAVRPLALALAGGSLLSLLPGMTPNVQAQAAPGLPAGLPSGLTVVQGQVKAVTTGKNLTVTNSSGSILNWQSFSIGTGNAVTFVQPNAQSQVLNRVVGNDPSAILGSLSSNGKVWLLNPNGVLFGQGARIDVGALVSSTLNLNDVDWLNGQSTGRFNLFGDSAASILNQGELRSSLGGHIALLGGSVRNEGLIEAPNGQILLAAGKSIELIDTGSPNLRLRVTAPQGEALNLGTLQAAGGRIDVHGAVVNQLGIVRADSLGTNAAGEIVLTASERLNLGQGSVTSASGSSGGKISLDSGAAGTTMVSGEVLATGRAGIGGNVTLLGKNVGLIDAAKIDASGATGGGQIHVGGGERGQDPSYRNSDGVYVGRDTSLIADATGNGDGGKIVLWADEATRAYGSFSARGGRLGGNGGFIETSGHWIDVSPARLDASAPVGLAGTWLLDPWNIDISDSVSTNSDAGTSPNFTAIGPGTAAIYTGDIAAALETQNVVISTGSGGSAAGNITMTGSIIAAPTAPVSLTLLAANDIIISGSTISSSPDSKTTSPNKLSVILDAGNHVQVSNDGSTPTLITTAGGSFTSTSRGIADSSFQYSTQVTGTTLSTGGGAINIDAAGSLSLLNNTITTNGGAFTSTSRGGYYYYSTSFDGTRLDTAGGDVSMGGQLDGSTDQNSFGPGVSFMSNPRNYGIDAGSGTVQIVGSANNGQRGGDAGQPTGVRFFGNGSISAGSISVQGSATTNPTSSGVMGIGVDGFNTTTLNASGSISIRGTGTDYGVRFGAFGPSNGIFINATGGTIYISGTNGASASTPSVVLTGSVAGTSVTLQANHALTLYASIGLSPTGLVTIAADDLANIVAPVASTAQIFVQSENVQLGSGGSLSSTATGDAIIVRGKTQNTQRFTNAAGASALSAVNGRWRVYSADPRTDTIGSLVYDYKQYAAAYGTASGSPAGSGNGFLYSLAPPSLTVYGGSLNKVYDASTQTALLSSSGAIVYGSINGDNISFAPTGRGSYSDKNVGNGKSITVATSAFTATDTASKPVYGYRFTGSLSGNITPVGISAINGITANSRVYDTTTNATLNTGSAGYTGRLGSDVLTVATASGAYADKNVGNGKLVSVTGLSLGGTDAGNYTLTSTTASATGNITPASISAITGITANSRVYDTTTNATLNTGSAGYTGRLGSDVLTVATASGAYADKNVGNGKLVSVTGLSLGGTDAGNYTLTSTTASATGNITPASISAITGITANSRVYDTTTNATLNTGSAGYTGRLGSDVLTVATASGAYADKNVGNGKLVSVTGLSLGGTDAGNYTLTSTTASATGNITPASISAITGITANSRVYDTTTNATLNTGSAGYTGRLGSDVLTVATASGAYADKNVGNGKLVSVTGLSLGGTDAGNYTLTSTTASATGNITPASISAITGITTANKTYDATTTATLNTASAGFTGRLGSDVLTVSSGTGSFRDASAGTGKAVGITGLSLGGADAGNYRLALTTASTMANITPAALTITANDASKNYGTTLVFNGSEFSSSGLIGADAVTSVSLSSNGAPASASVAGGPYPIVASNATGGSFSAANYNITYRDGRLTVNPAEVNAVLASIVGNPTKVYDGTHLATLSATNFGLTGFVGTDSATITKTSGTYNSADAGSRTVSTSLANGDFNPVGSTDMRNYTLPTTASGTGTITQKTLTLTGVAANNKTYDGSTVASLSSAGTLSGLVGAQTLIVSNTGAAFDTKDAGSAKMVTVGGITLANGTGLASNYQVAPAATTTADITQKTLTLSGLSAANKVYDGNTAASVTVSGLTGLVGSETLSTSTSGSFDNKDAGTAKTVTVGVTLANGSHGGLAGNYRVAPTSTTADITQKTLTLSGLSAANKVYDGNTTASVTVSGLTGLVGSETLVTSTSGNFDNKDAGTAKTVTVGVTLANGNGGLARNYRVAPTATTTADITQKTLTLSGLSAANKVYDGNTTASVTLSGLSGLVGSETLSNTTSGSFDTKDAGTAKTVTVGVTLANGSNGGLASNYRVAPSTTTTANVTPKALTVTANDANKAYGNTLNFTGNQFTSTGLVGSETIGSVSLSSTGATALASVAGGPYPIVASNAVGGTFSIANYNVNYVNGTLTVNPAELNVVLASIVGNPTKVYDGNNLATLSASNFDLTGFVGTDSAAVTKTSGTYNSADAGSRTVSTTLANGDFNPLGSTDLRNYTLPSTASGTGTITQKLLTLTGVAANSKAYDGTTLAGLSNAGTLNGLVAGQTLTLSNTGSTFDTKDAGTGKTVTVGGLTLANGTGLASNYQVAPTATTSADITQKTLTLAGLSAADKVYDGNTAANVTLGGLTGLIGTETLRTTISGNFDTKDAGIAKTVTVGVTLANGSNGGLAGNYRVAPSTSTSADVTPKTLTASGLTAANKVYDGDTIASVTLSGLTGLVGSETLSTSTSGSFDTKDAGTAKTVTVGITLANGSNGGLASNYRVAPTAATTADITQKTLTLSGLTAANKTYDGTALASVTTGALTGLVGDETLGVSTASAQFDTKDVGAAKAVNVAGIGLVSGTGLAGNYRLADTATTSADITPATLTVSANNAAKTFGNTLSFTGTEFTSTALVGNEALTSVTLTSAGAAATASVAGGPYAITASNASGSGFDARNYDVRYVNGSLTVNPANLSAVMLNIVGNPTKTYDGTTVATLTSANFGLTGFVGTDTATVTQTSGRYDSANAGSRTVTVNLARTDYAATGSTDLRNYALPVVTSGSGTIVPRPVTASGAAAANKVYDGNTSATVTAVSLSGLVGDETLAVGNTAALFDTKDAGTGKTVTVTGITLANGTGLASNYRLSGTTASTTADITPKALTVTATNASKTYGTALGLAGNEFTSAGLVGSETIGGVSLSSTGAPASASVAGGPYPIVASNAVGGTFSIANYNVNYVNGTLTVNPAELNVVLASIVGNPTKVYDGNNLATLSASNFDLTGFVGTDSAAVTKTSGTYNSADAGSRTVSTTLANGDFNPLGSTDLRNYTLPSTASGTGTITQKLLTLTGVAANSKAYDGTTLAGLSNAGTLNGLVAGQTLTLSNTGSTFDTKDAGTGKTVTVGGLTLANGTGLASNYQVAPTATTSADITQKTLTLAGLSAADKVYDGNTAANVTLGGLTGLVGTETLGTSTSGSFDAKDAGTAKTVTVDVTLANGSNGGLAGNYRVAPASTSANITPATLTYTANPANKMVGAPTPALSGAVSGFVANETLASATTGSLGFVTPATATSPAGSYAVDGAGLSATNYRFVQAPGNASALTVTGLQQQQIDEGSKSALGLTLTTVTPKKEWSSPDEGRVFDAVQAMQAAAFGQLPLFNAIQVDNMSFDSLSALLASRDRYKKALFADAIHQLELDPSLADARACTSIADAESGGCVITEKIKDEIRSLHVAQPQAAAPSPAPATPGADTAAPAPAAGTAGLASTTPALRPAPPWFSFLRRNVRTASLPQIERKIAVVIGTNQYADKSIPQLENAVGDAQAIGKLLESTLGYETIVLTNSSKQAVVRTLNRLAVEVGPNDSVVVYYAGHGELVEATGLGYWQLADSDAKKPETWLSNADISRLVKQIGASQVALISDSCYSGSLVDERIRASGTQTDPRQLLGRKTVVVMSSGGNEPVFDAGKEGHSPFAYSLMTNLRQVTSWQAGGNVFERVRFAVARELPQRPHYGAAAAAGHQSGGDYLFEQRQLEAIP